MQRLCLWKKGTESNKAYLWWLFWNVEKDSSEKTSSAKWENSFLINEPQEEQLKKIISERIHRQDGVFSAVNENIKKPPWKNSESV